MDKIARAVRDYAARKFVPLSGASPLTRRSHPPDFLVVLNDLGVVLNDLNVASWCVLVEHGYPEEPPELVSPSFEPTEEIEAVEHAGQADLFPGW
ncbi:hypothetical protein [Candidatus Palauibacter sp.]|uniref:hypothetical protein n=1 Tax=Candidatus Palauibacter sp. TaxID=3101350 RepID=UPI003B01F65F